MGFFFHAVRGRMVAKPAAGGRARGRGRRRASPARSPIADRPDWSLLFYYVVALAASAFRARGTSWPCRPRRRVAGYREQPGRRRLERDRGPGAQPAGDRRGDGRDGRDHARQPRADRGPRRGGAPRRGRRARALRPRPARPARPFAVGHRAEGAARAPAPAPRSRGRRRRRRPTSRRSPATRCARCARRSAATTGRRSTPSSRARGRRSARRASRPPSTARRWRCRPTSRPCWRGPCARPRPT